jgi:hypothetical protein
MTVFSPLDELVRTSSLASLDINSTRETVVRGTPSISSSSKSLVFLDSSSTGLTSI